MGILDRLIRYANPQTGVANAISDVVNYVNERNVERGEEPFFQPVGRAVPGAIERTMMAGQAVDHAVTASTSMGLKLLEDAREGSRGGAGWHTSPPGRFDDDRVHLTVKYDGEIVAHYYEDGTGTTFFPKTTRDREGVTMDDNPCYPEDRCAWLKGPTRDDIDR